MKITAIVAAQLMHPYTGNTSFIGHAFEASDATGQRFFERGTWADVRYASIQTLTAAGLVPEVDFRPGGTAGSRLQIRWDGDVVAKVLKARLSGSKKARPAVVETPATPEEIEAVLALMSK